MRFATENTLTYRFSWLLMASLNLTMVVCGSVGLATDVADTVDGSGAFFFPNQFIDGKFATDADWGFGAKENLAKKNGSIPMPVKTRKVVDGLLSQRALSFRRAPAQPGTAVDLVRVDRWD